ncbi:MAG: 16S rRNA processing protein RimM [Candidatus Latescibacteria bacterium]|nr:16S rRNA processing protein RimM [Candidatus Latescibacterota bacterium]MBT5830873.1 16S rRNA processing protein RimM [Candidatus Latescibacterota bacterium]
MADDNLDYIAIGRVSKPRGIRGEAFLVPLTDFPERFKGLRMIRAESPDGSHTDLDIDYVRQYGNRMGIKLRGVDTPETVSQFRNYVLQVPRDDVHPLPDDTFYVFEVIGMPVETTSGDLIGKVVDILSIPANDVYVVDRNGEELLLPAARDVLTIDRDAGKIVVQEIDGLL